MSFDYTALYSTFEHQPTPEQDAIVRAAVETTDNLAVIARAGAAKTSTLIFIARALSKTEILCLAFNKAIAEEMNKRLPKNCQARTLHSLGMRVWGQYTSKRGRVDGRKCYSILRGMIDEIDDQEEKNEAFGLMSEILQLVSQAKNDGFIPKHPQTSIARSLLSEDDFYLSLPLEPAELEWELAQAVLIESFRQAREGDIDFDDMIYCPAIVSGCSWPTHPVTLIDESQDLSPINHHILKKLVKKNRIIAVGDPCQAIYGFRGALSDSMSRLIEKFDMETLNLTISFRCAKAITKAAQWRAPDMTWPEWATEGIVLRLDVWDSNMIKDGDAIICRNNAPLFGIAISLINEGRLPEIVGRDILKPLEKVLKSLGKDNMPAAGALEKLEEWENKQLKKARDGARGAIHDKARCLRLIIDKVDTLGNAKAYLLNLLQRSGRILLMTGHKSKGLEFDNVWFLDQHFCRIEHEQDANIKYVIETRAKKQLAYVQTANFQSMVTEEE